MHRFKRIILAVVVLFFVFFVLAFVLENQQTASLLFFGWSTVELPISVFVTLSLIVGMMVGPALGLLIGSRRLGRKA
ncbi:DUF1049 domain-containing protein [Pseudomonas marginalis]|jgi:uncharacterized integral membrane protein|uniref:DUF1049 domain-containing protein n=1 Tax=Pseudomonas TaxID=286 RepID=UPI00081C18AD|nr:MULTISPECIES: DUF1049 domain-containing protein [Pseudomonas]NMZ91236.1 DUF1049 domain-containing protein [Pseudomonas marginalis]